MKMENKTLSGKDLSKRVPAMDERIKWINCFIKQSAEIAEYDIGDDQREDRSSEEIVNTKNGLCVINQNDRAGRILYGAVGSRASSDTNTIHIWG
jgi:hypothetical protein